MDSNRLGHMFELTCVFEHQPTKTHLHFDSDGILPMHVNPDLRFNDFGSFWVPLNIAEKTLRVYAFLKTAFWLSFPLLVMWFDCAST